MGNITNPIAMRLKRYGLWQINWSVYFRQEFSSYFTVGLSLDKFLYSFTLLKGFFKRFFFFELKYFLYTSYLMVFVCLKFFRKQKSLIKKPLKFINFFKTFKRIKYNKNLLYLFSRKKYLQYLQNSFLNFGSSYGYIMIYILFFSMILFKYKQNVTFDFKKISLYNHMTNQNLKNYFASIVNIFYVKINIKDFYYTSYLMVFVCLKFIRKKTFLKKFK